MSENNNKKRMAIIGALIGVAAFWSFQWGMVGGLFEEDLIWIAIIPGILAGGVIGWLVFGGLCLLINKYCYIQKVED